MRQCRLDAGSLWRISLPAKHRIEPDDAAAAAGERFHLSPQQRRITRLVAVGDDHHACARMDDASGMPAVEGLQTLANAGSAAGTLRHDRQAIESARGILLLHGIGDVSKPRVEQEGFSLAKLDQNAMNEA